MRLQGLLLLFGFVFAVHGVFMVMSLVIGVDGLGS